MASLSALAAPAPLNACQRQNNVRVTVDSELYRRKPVLTYAISGNVVGGVGEFGE